MNRSPLKFAMEFERLKSSLQTISTPDLRLYEMMDFWPLLREYHDNKSYQSYFDEYIPLFLHLISDAGLSDFRMDELSNLRNILHEFQNLNIVAEQLKEKIRIVAIRLASINFYVGQTTDGLEIIADLTGSKFTDKLAFEEAEGLNEYESFKRVCEYFKERDERIYGVLREILNDWEGEREYLCHDRINCLFVEKDGQGKSRRGRLRKLQGSIEAARKTARTDEITFDNQLKSPDDPFVGVAYDSLKAVRKVMGRTAFRKHSKAYFHAHLVIKDSGQTFTGDSIGLAIGLLTYVQLLKPEIMRQERLLSSEIAVTGGVDENGKITPINEETLPAKIERAFFSPIKYLVLPQANYKSAREYLDKLQAEYPNRHLILIGADWLSEVFCNLNIVREQKVCLGEFVAQKAYRYTRMTKIQIPLLLILIYFLVCQICPKAWFAFDWNPEYVKLTSTGFQALNKDSIPLWSKDYSCEEIDEKSQWKVYDINQDNNNEVLFILKSAESTICEDNTNLYAYNYKGNLLFQRNCVIYDEYPGDTLINQPYGVTPIEIFKSGGKSIIKTQIYKSPYARTHFKFWNTDGDSLGWFIEEGHMGCNGKNFLIDSDGRAVFLSYNNRMNCASLFVLNPKSSFGVSPPYILPFHKQYIKGNQLHYILFKRTDLNHVTISKYNYPVDLVHESENIIKAAIRETDSGQTILLYTFNENYRIINIVVNDEFWNNRKPYIKSEILPDLDMSDYKNILFDSVTYWIDSTWVTEGELRALENK